VGRRPLHKASLFDDTNSPQQTFMLRAFLLRTGLLIGLNFSFAKKKASGFLLL